MPNWLENLLKNRGLWLALWGLVKVVLSFVPGLPAALIPALDVFVVAVLAILTVDNVAVKVGNGLAKLRG